MKLRPQEGPHVVIVLMVGILLIPMLLMAWIFAVAAEALDELEWRI